MSCTHRSDTLIDAVDSAVTTRRSPCRHHTYTRSVVRIMDCVNILDRERSRRSMCVLFDLTLHCLSSATMTHDQKVCQRSDGSHETDTDAADQDVQPPVTTATSSRLLFEQIVHVDERHLKRGRGRIDALVTHELHEVGLELRLDKVVVGSRIDVADGSRRKVVVVDRAHGVVGEQQDHVIDARTIGLVEHEALRVVIDARQATTTSRDEPLILREELVPDGSLHRARL